MLLGKSENQKKHEFLYWEYHSGRATSQAVLLDGRWKGLRNGSRSAPLELYDLHSDEVEKQNVAARHPDITARIEAVLTSGRDDSTDWPLRDAP